MELTLFNILLVIALAPLALAVGYILMIAVLGGIFGGTAWLVNRRDTWG